MSFLRDKKDVQKVASLKKKARKPWVSTLRAQTNAFAWDGSFGPFTKTEGRGELGDFLSKTREIFYRLARKRVACVAIAIRGVGPYFCFRAASPGLIR